MKITKITLSEYKPFIQNKKQNNQTERETAVSNTIQSGYRDFNINFRGRTPENFYEQEFNVKFMPDTMKKFLNANYEERKHIPPEQVMSESFKYLAVTDNFSDVKYVYPEETLFSNLHEASLKGRSGILSDIKLAKEMSDTPLLNDGNDHLGIYLLKKIYLEGKTIREINKDFYEKDLNPEYKGIVTQPITYGTTSAYGIQYPKTDFWNSFIATRDEYKKFFVNLPKQNKSELKKELTKLHSENSANVNKANKVEEDSKPRKYTIKKYQKDQIKNDIIKSKGDEKAIKNAIVKRFKKDDPEAAFIVKYLSPVMTVAADKIHLSEEMKYFAQSEKNNGKRIENFFAQFWKARPDLLEHYSTAITDTIELFEETYSSGGVLPINNEYRLITKNTENQKPIDFVPQRFVELLDYVQTIVPEREKFYAMHEEEQAKWNEHFLWRYGDVKAEQTVEPQQKINKTPLELLEESARENNAKVYTLRGINGDTLHITANLDETLGDYIRREYTGFPTKFINLIVNKALKNPFMTEDAKLSFATAQMADEINDDRILGEAERKYIMNSVTSELTQEISAASMASLDVLASKSNMPYKVYRTLIPNHTADDINEYSSLLLKYYGNSDIDKEMNDLYDLYKKPLTNSEVTKITLIVMDYIRNFNLKFANSPESVFYMNTNIIEHLSKFQEKLNIKEFKQTLKSEIADNITRCPFGKSLLSKKETAAITKAKTEIFVNVLLNNMFNFIMKNKTLIK